jgi:small-conductance mechanosensitive channel
MVGLGGAEGNTLAGPFASLFAAPTAHASVIEQPQAFAIRAGLTALVLLLALTLGPRLARQVGTAPPRIPARIGPVGLARIRPSHVAAREGPGTWLSAVTLTSVWTAAAAAIAVIWLWGRSGFLPDNPRVILTQAGYILTRVAITLLVLVVTLALARTLDTAVELGLERGHVNKNLLVLAGHAIYATTLIVGLIVMLTVWGVSLVVPVTLIGVLTVALSLALQDILKNVVAGVYLLIERPFVIGDQITVESYSGTIEDVQIRVTRLRTSDGQLVVIPNATLFTTPVVNKSFYERRRVSLTVTLPESGPGGTDGLGTMETTEAAILASLSAIPGVRDEPAPEVTLRGSSAGRLELRAAFWMPTGDPRREAATISEAIERLRLRLPDAEITPTGSAPAHV